MGRTAPTGRGRAGASIRDHDDLVAFVAAKARETDVNQHVHVAWMCVSEDGRRVEEAEIELHRRLAEFMPVLGVITKARADEGFRAEVQRHLPEARNVVSVRALSERFDDSDVVLPPMGLEELLEATTEVIPEAVQRAFAAAQKASIELKKKKAHKVVVAAAASAAGVGAAPIPFADAALLVPIQIGMLAGISATFGIELSRAFLGTLVAAMAGTTGAAFLGRAVVSNLLKFIPGLGTIAGGAIAATTAAALTTGLGEIYITVLARLFTASEGDAPSPEAIAREFKDRLAFPRPALTAGGSMEGNECQQDLDAAEEVLGWFILRHRPELVIITSRFAGRFAENGLRESDIPCVITPHPGTRWWNTVTRSYGYVRGRDLFANFLQDWQLGDTRSSDSPLTRRRQKQ